MEIKLYSDENKEAVIRFLEMCHQYIHKILNLDSTDADLLSISDEYGGQKQGFWCLLDENREIIGTIGVRTLWHKGEQYAEVRRLYIKPTQQGKGYGSLLFDHACKFAKECGYRKIRGTTSFERETMVAMLERRGFQRIPQYRPSNADLFFELQITPKYQNHCDQIKKSLNQQSKSFQNSLILNPVENIPKESILAPCTSFLHGLYNTDSIRMPEEKIDTKIQFGGRNEIASDVNYIYNLWSDLLGAEALSMRLLSGLHAHIILFMSITSIGDRVLLLPERAGGHMATLAILERLGLEVKEFITNIANQRVDVDATLELVKLFRPNVIFVDRSEGLIYEDFSWLKDIDDAYKVFDASQYLTNIICKDYVNPFDMGFDMILSTLHKNLPGPQRAMICVKQSNDVWKQLRSKISIYVSNMHVFSIYSAGLLLNDYENIKQLSKGMLENALCLEQELANREVPVVRRHYSPSEPATHHIWIRANDKQAAFGFYLDLERIGLMTNYRLLPYDLGYGLRIGMSAATYSGLILKDISYLADIISQVYQGGYSQEVEDESRSFIRRIKARISDE